MTRPSSFLAGSSFFRTRTSCRHVYGPHGGVSQRRLQRRDYGGRQQEPRNRSDRPHHPCQHHLRSAHAACRKWPDRHRSIPGQHHPAGRFDPVALRIQNLIPLPLCTAGPPCSTSGIVQNFQNSELVKRDTEAPSLKLDHSFGPKDKLSFFWSRTMTYTATGYGEDGRASAHLRHVRRRNLFASRAPEL